MAVRNGEVTLTGTVEDRRMKRLAEDIVEDLSGVKAVQSQLRVQAQIITIQIFAYTLVRQ